jgi:hypothetical protein
MHLKFLLKFNIFLRRFTNTAPEYVLLKHLQLIQTQFSPHYFHEGCDRYWSCQTMRRSRNGLVLIYTAFND